jgi:hypothetical protein
MPETISSVKNADTLDIIDVMLDAWPISRQQGALLLQFFDISSGESLGRDIHKFLRTKIRYRADRGNQIVQTPKRLLETKRGDCKSYSLFAASILHHAGYSVQLIYTNFDGTDWPDHVYVQYFDEYGLKYFLDGTIDKFNSESLHLSKWLMHL